MIETIQNNPQESRKEYLLWFFERAEKRMPQHQYINFGNIIISPLNYGVKTL
ncbi:hypothetical protein ACFSKN_14485 [Mariniflexile gromovii]|uniref:Uncharacterized protein n=1 Tax=Mariniflexile gromovii TaxID=362523 RepID=A0ABS4BRZ7_9FLAO|nr:hypothetical protein [Mariniflexile gromovii]MBP0903178.1 hypothetical protein [Mariniflexile gromovii]